MIIGIIEMPRTNQSVNTEHHWYRSMWLEETCKLGLKFHHPREMYRYKLIEQTNQGVTERVVCTFQRLSMTGRPGKDGPVYPIGVKYYPPRIQYPVRVNHFLFSNMIGKVLSRLTGIEPFTTVRHQSTNELVSAASDVNISGFSWDLRKFINDNYSEVAGLIDCYNDSEFFSVSGDVEALNYLIDQDDECSTRVGLEEKYMHATLPHLDEWSKQLLDHRKGISERELRVRKGMAFNPMWQHYRNFQSPTTPKDGGNALCCDMNDELFNFIEEVDTAPYTEFHVKVECETRRIENATWFSHSTILVKPNQYIESIAGKGYALLSTMYGPDVRAFELIRTVREELCLVVDLGKETKYHNIDLIAYQLGIPYILDWCWSEYL